MNNAELAAKMFERFKTLSLGGAAERDAFMATVLEYFSSTDGWIVPDDKLNVPQQRAVRRMIDRAKLAQYTDVQLRILGSFEYHQAEWIKQLRRKFAP